MRVTELLGVIQIERPFEVLVFDPVLALAAPAQLPADR